MRRFLLLLNLLVILSSQAQVSEIDQKKFSGKFRQFDFWIGKWNVNLRRQQPDNSWSDWKKAVTL